MNIQAALLNVTSTVSPMLSHIHMPYSRKLITGKDFRNIEAMAKPGQVILSKTNGELSNLFIPGFWSHAGIISPDGKHVIEAKTANTAKTDLVDFCMINKDYICLLDPVFLSDAAKLAAAIYAEEEEVGLPYDFEMSLSNIKKLYCSELVYKAYLFADEKIPFKPRSILGQETIVPNDFWAASDKFKVIYTSEAFTL